MALQSWGHSQYWAVSSTGGGGGSNGNNRRHYPKWQTSIFVHHQMLTCGSLLGGLQAWWDRLCVQWALWRMCRQWTPLEQAAIVRVLTVVRHPIYQTARLAVRDTATKPTMRDHHYWNEVARVAKAWNWSENVYRRLDANEHADRLLRVQGSTVTHAMRELAVELAYQELKAVGR